MVLVGVGLSLVFVLGWKPEALNDERVDSLDSPVGRQFQVHQLHDTADTASTAFSSKTQGTTHGSTGC